MREQPPKWMTLEIRGSIDDRILIEWENGPGGTRPRARIQKNSCFEWEIYLEREMPVDHRLAKGWMRVATEPTKKRAIRKAQSLLLQYRNPR